MFGKQKGELTMSFWEGRAVTSLESSGLIVSVQDCKSVLS